MAVSLWELHGDEENKRQQQYLYLYFCFQKWGDEGMWLLGTEWVATHSSAWVAHD